MEKKTNIVDKFLYGRAGKRSLATQFLYGDAVALKEAKAGKEDFGWDYSKNIDTEFGGAAVLAGAIVDTGCITGALVALGLAGEDVAPSLALGLHAIPGAFVAGGYLLNKHGRVKDRVEMVERMDEETSFEMSPSLR